ncbi:MAG: Npt1/Npt2 family nucleotide transporter [Rickettsiaceae bacterium]|nr:Npt1/Npt2 family nucleotide transporter [Rickettsiaceae bacterium]
MSNIELNPFTNKIRNALWPIRNSELSKFIPMSALMFCILFNQNVLRILKDSILISEVSAEVTSFTKLYCVAPMATIFVIIYAKMVNHLPFQKIYYYLIAVFTAFYVLFAFTIYPNIDTFHMDQNTAFSLMAEHPHLKWYIAGFANWSYVLFYTFSELWPNIFYLLLFWQIANEITSTNEAKRFYTLFPFFGNSSLILVGLLMMNLSSDNNIIHRLFTTSEHKIILTQISVAMIAVSSVLSCILVRYITTHIMVDSYITDGKRSKRPKMGLIESFKYITRSRYLWLMLVCSASFGLSMNLVEAVWKAKMKELYPTVTAYASYNSMYILWTGIAIMVMSMIGNSVMRNSSWFTAAIISPLLIFSTGTIFFFLVVFDNQVLNLFDGMILMSPLALAVFVGAIQNVLAKGSKYSIWDTSTQMLYIPLDQELRTKGKAAVDVISGKIGKSTSGLIQSLIFTIVPMATYHSIAPGLMIVFISICMLWIYAIRKIYFEYQKIV